MAYPHEIQKNQDEKEGKRRKFEGYGGGIEEK